MIYLYGWMWLSFILLSNILFYEYITVYLSTLLSMGITGIFQLIAVIRRSSINISAHIP